MNLLEKKSARLSLVRGPETRSGPPLETPDSHSVNRRGLSRSCRGQNLPKERVALHTVSRSTSPKKVAFSEEMMNPEPYTEDDLNAFYDVSRNHKYDKREFEAAIRWRRQE